jgi:RNA polymerase-binding transcription factor DksA
MRVTRSFLPSVESQASGAGLLSLPSVLLDHAPWSATLGDQGQAGTCPRGHAAIEVLGTKPALPQPLGSAIASRSAATDRDHGLPFRYLPEARPELAKGDVLRTLNMPGVPLVLLADVEKMQLGTPLADVLWQHSPILAHGGDMDANAIRERLERERADLAATVERIKERLAVPQRDSGGDVALADQHPADVASETEARELDLARETMFEARIGLIDEALKRLERGEYGRCIICGREIPEARLDLVPETPYCVDDAEREQQSSPR